METTNAALTATDRETWTRQWRNAKLRELETLTDDMLAEFDDVLHVMARGYLAHDDPPATFREVAEHYGTKLELIEEMRAGVVIDWFSPSFGGHKHEAADGSWVGDEHALTEAVES